MILQTPTQIRKDAAPLKDPPNHQVRKYEPETSGEDFGQNIQYRSQRWQPNSSTPPEMMPTLRTATGNSGKVESP